MFEWNEGPNCQLITTLLFALYEFQSPGWRENHAGPVWLTRSNGRPWLTEMWGNSLHPAWQQYSDNFQRFLRTLRWNDCCSKQRRFNLQFKAVDKSGLKWRRMVRKGEIKMLKKLSKQRKILLRPCCKTGHHLICNPGIPDAKIFSFGSKNVQITLLRGIWSSVEFQQFPRKLSILENHLPLAWE